MFPTVRNLQLDVNYVLSQFNMFAFESVVCPKDGFFGFNDDESNGDDDFGGGGG